MSETMEADDVTGRIEDSERVSPDARRVAQEIDEYSDVHAVDPCGTVKGAAEVTVPTPTTSVSMALDGTGYEVRGVLICEDDYRAKLWIAPE